MMVSEKHDWKHKTIIRVNSLCELMLFDKSELFSKNNVPGAVE